MDRYMHVYETKESHDADHNYKSANYLEPWVAYTEQTREVSFDIPPKEKYLTFEALESGTFTLTIHANVTTTYLSSVSYSLDHGLTWTTTNNSSNAVTITTPTVQAGDVVLWKGIGKTYGTGMNYYSTFSSTGEFSVYGNTMSLFYGDNFVNKTAFNGNYDYNFYKLFNEATKLKDASFLILPSTQMKDSCYSYMFNGCSSLTTAPVLPATTMANKCYDHMFSLCYALTGCPSVLPATTLAERCYFYMFYGCTALTTPPVLYATTLANYCCSEMFLSCTSLTSAPALPAKTLSMNCYSSMFRGCTSLTTAPELPATTLVERCYMSMFSNCTSLTTAPVLPATTLAIYCYNNMFKGCTSLNYIKMLATNIDADYCMEEWVNNVSSTGTFVQNGSATWYYTGPNGIPDGWTISYHGQSSAAEQYKTEREQYCSQHILTFTALESGTFTLTIPGNVNTFYVTNASYSLDNGETWTTTENTSSDVTITTPVVETGDTVLWKGNALRLATNSADNTTTGTDYNASFSSTGRFDVSGDPQSLLSRIWDTRIPQYAFTKLFIKCTGLVSAQQIVLSYCSSYCYLSMFYGCTSLTTAPSTLPATTIGVRCYYNMFYGCTALTTAPSTLPATTLAQNCYSNMFQNCTSLTTAPTLPATTLITGQSCYSGMFQGCTALTTAPALPATTLVNNCYQYMFLGCTALTTAPALPATKLAQGCYSYMFNGCTALTTAPELPAKTLVSSCYTQMFKGCTHLNYIKAMFTTTPSTTYTQNWVQNVASTGRFVKRSSATWNVTGVNGVPSGWTVETASE